MKYYLLPKMGATQEELVGTELEVKTGLKERGLKGNPKDLTHDIPVDKQGLMTYVNDLLGRIHELEYSQDFTPEANLSAQEPVQPEIVKEVTVPVTPEPRGPTETGMVPTILEAQIEALGEGGYPALERLDSHQQLTGIGSAFARGIILLCVLASGEHQLARIFHRKK